MKKTILTLLLLLSCTQLNAKPILISFDGSDYLDRWEDTLNFAKENGVKFTYFISAPYFKTESEEAKNPYWALTELTDKCLIKPRKDDQINSIILRGEYVDRAIREGHDIGSHLCGHYDGRPWTHEQWQKEFGWFKWALGDRIKYVVGCRAPYLCINKDYFRVMHEFGYKYDSSTLSTRIPVYADSGVADVIREIPIKKMKVIADGYKYTGPKTCAPFDCDFIVLVQYSLFPDTKPFESIINCTDPHILEEMKKIEDVFFDTLCYDYLNTTYPTQICLHFQKRSGDSYMRAMKRFVIWVKDKNPQFMTYREYAGAE